LSRDVERCTSANVDAIAKGLKVDETSVGTEVDSEGRDIRAVGPKRNVSEGIRDDS
jgi:hypothetical protein